jgi:tetraacyldisaccharide 4'-kinase
MIPNVTDLTLQLLRHRLWHHWFQGKVVSPFREIPSLERTPSLLKRSMQRRLLRAGWASSLLWFLGLPLLYGLSRLARLEARRRYAAQTRAPSVPQGLTIAVGNLLVGGTGKTPLIIHLAKDLRQRGHQVAVLSRGYKRGGLGLSNRDCLVLGPDCRSPVTGELLTPEACGDEPWLIALRAAVPVGIGQDRYKAAQSLHQHFPTIDTWLLDDGLSQTSLRPDARILLLDARGLGNGHCLPYGPLRSEWTRELASAWSSPSATKANKSSFQPLMLAHPKGRNFEELFEARGYSAPGRLAISRSAACWVRVQISDGSVLSEERLNLEEGCQRFRTSARSLIAAAGIAQPYAFFENLTALGLTIQHKLELPNHEPRILQAIQAWIQNEKIPSNSILLTTEKDAVKLAWQGAQAEAAGVIEWWALQLELAIEPSNLEFPYGCKTT